MKALPIWLLALSSSVLAHEHINTKALKDNLGNTSQSTIFGERHRQIPPSSVASPSPTTGSRFNEQHINRAIAEWSLRQVNSTLELIDDAWATEEVYAMTAKMNAQVRTHALLGVPIIADDSINAFAVPGGLIGMNTGTILASGSMDEVASVLAHEIAHLSQRHYEHRQDEKGKLMALQLGGLLTAILASSVSGDLATTALIGSQTATAETMATHSREHEKEADRIGMQIMSQAGYDARGMAMFFDKLYKQVAFLQSKDAFIPSFVQSHPLTAERLSEASARASQYPLVSMLTKTHQASLFDKLSWRLKYLTKKSTLSELKTASTHSRGAYLAYVSALSDEGKSTLALQAFEAGKFERADPLVCVVHGRILSKLHRYTEAVAVLSACHAIYPERRDLALHLAEALINAGRTAQALTLLKPLTERANHDRQAWALTQKAYERSTNTPFATINALHASSQVALWQGQYQGALQSNAQAIKIAKENPNLNLLPMLERTKEMMVLARDYKP